MKNPALTATSARRRRATVEVSWRRARTPSCVTSIPARPGSMIASLIRSATVRLDTMPLRTVTPGASCRDFQWIWLIQPWVTAWLPAAGIAATMLSGTAASAWSATATAAMPAYRRSRGTLRTLRCTTLERARGALIS